MADNIISSEGNKDFVLLSTNLNAYKSSSSSSSNSSTSNIDDNDKLFIKKEIDSFSNTAISNEFDVAKQHVNSNQYGFNRINSANPLYSEHYQPIQNDFSLQNDFKYSLNSNRNNYDWSTSNQQFNYNFNSNQQTYPEFTKYNTNNSCYYSNTQNYQTPYYDNDHYKNTNFKTTNQYNFNNSYYSSIKYSNDVNSMSYNDSIKPNSINYLSNTNLK